jgi:two-component system phosphate regulon sensor histidine kinase PhoR
MMNSKKIKLIWSLSIAVALLVILLQGYWLYNQYRFTLEKKADETTDHILTAWDDYRGWKKEELRARRENLKAYNSNADQNSTIYISDVRGNVTDWDITIRTITAADKPAQPSADSLNDRKKSKHDRFTLNQIDKSLQRMQRRIEMPVDSSKRWEELVTEIDSVTIHTFRFRTAESQNLVYDAVTMFLAGINSPFMTSEIDSIIRLKTDFAPEKIDTLSLPSDSVLWQPKVVKRLSATHPLVKVDIPYNTLKRKVVSITVPVIPARIIRTMMRQIVISVILILALVVCLQLQIQTISRQQRISKLRQNFVNTSIHELKRPVQTLKSIVSYLQRSSPGESEMLNSARAETDNLTAYLQKLREVNQAETIAGSLHYSFFDFAALAAECIESIRKGGEKPVRIETCFAAPSLCVTADRVITGNIIINLLENAVKYSGDAPQIRFRAENRDDCLLFAISDNGIGIAASEQHHVFEPFYRSKSGYVASLPGMGLGLSYVKMAVEAHRGSVEISSGPDIGTTVTVKIPRQ